jgi:hypothetical protein
MVRRLLQLEEVEDVLGTGRGPQRQESMIIVGERSPTADGDEARVPLLGQDHGSTMPRGTGP